MCNFRWRHNWHRLHTPPPLGQASSSSPLCPSPSFLLHAALLGSFILQSGDTPKRCPGQMTNGPKRGEQERRKKRRERGGQRGGQAKQLQWDTLLGLLAICKIRNLPCQTTVPAGTAWTGLACLASPLSLFLSLFSSLLFALLGHLFDSTFDYFYDRIAFYCFYFWSRNVGQVDIVISFFFCCLRSHTAYEQLPVTFRSSTCEISWQNEVRKGRREGGERGVTDCRASLIDFRFLFFSFCA